MAKSDKPRKRSTTTPGVEQGRPLAQQNDEKWRKKSVHMGRAGKQIHIRITRKNEVRD